MCGIAGFWSTAKQDQPAGILSRMTNALAYRGPDDYGAWFDPSPGIGLGHRRLSIIDLSPEGHQPMFSPSGRYVIAFNGEVYNFEQLRRELKHHSWRGSSDTEVMLAAIEEWGLPGAVNRFVGMFAFALWDRKETQLHLVRDRIGIKPLYYGTNGGTLLFGSELKALQAHPEFVGEVARNSIAAMLRYSYIPAPHTIFKATHKLQPGTIATFPGPTIRPEITSYWSAKDVASLGANRQFAGSVKDCISELESLLRDAVRLRMIADVPLGAFLSGGIDSTLVAALMQSMSTRPVKTYTIGFSEPSYNEANFAKRVAEQIGTAHTELYLSVEETLRAIKTLPIHYDEPFADASQLPTLLVSQLARTEVTVALSGDGGDELFGGYNRYLWLNNIVNFKRVTPAFARSALARILKKVNSNDLDIGGEMLQHLVPQRFRFRNAGTKVHKFISLLPLNDSEQMYRRVVSTWDNACEIVLGCDEEGSTPGVSSSAFDSISKMMLMDLLNYLPDDVLTKVDRASMAFGLEARVPLLDHRVVEFAWRIPLEWKIRDGQGKWILRELLSRYVPKRLFERPKSGFGVPIGMWLRGPLRNWAEDLLHEDKLRREGFLDAVRIRSVWQQHLNNRGNWQQHLWCILMFEAWLDAQTNWKPARDPDRAGIASGMPLSSNQR